MSALFPGEPRELPPQQGWTWVVRSDDPPKPPPVRHAAGYEPLIDYLRPFGIAPEVLLEPWAFAHVVRAHREAFEADAALQRAAVVFLGNAFIARHPDCAWRHPSRGLVIESEDPTSEWVDGVEVLPPGRRSIGVERTIQAILDADEARFREFAGVVETWGPGSEHRPPWRRPDASGYSPDAGS